LLKRKTLRKKEEEVYNYLEKLLRIGGQEGKNLPTRLLI
jgi:hypothetical protein